MPRSERTGEAGPDLERVLRAQEGNGVRETYTTKHLEALAPMNAELGARRPEAKQLCSDMHDSPCSTQKTLNVKTRCLSCHGKRGQDGGRNRGVWCSGCLDTRVGEDLQQVLRDPAWRCPACRGLCNCSAPNCVRAMRGLEPTAQLVYEARDLGYSSVAHYLRHAARRPARAAADEERARAEAAAARELLGQQQASASALLASMGIRPGLFVADDAFAEEAAAEGALPLLRAVSGNHPPANPSERQRAPGLLLCWPPRTSRPQPRGDAGVAPPGGGGTGVGIATGSEDDVMAEGTPAELAGAMRPFALSWQLPDAARQRALQLRAAAAGLAEAGATAAREAGPHAAAPSAAGACPAAAAVRVGAPAPVVLPDATRAAADAPQARAPAPPPAPVRTIGLGIDLGPDPRRAPPTSAGGLGAAAAAGGAGASPASPAARGLAQAPPPPGAAAAAAAPGLPGGAAAAALVPQGLQGPQGAQLPQAGARKRRIEEVLGRQPLAEAGEAGAEAATAVLPAGSLPPWFTRPPAEAPAPRTPAGTEGRAVAVVGPAGPSALAAPDAVAAAAAAAPAAAARPGSDVSPARGQQPAAPGAWHQPRNPADVPLPRDPPPDGAPYAEWLLGLQRCGRDYCARHAALPQPAPTSGAGAGGGAWYAAWEQLLTRAFQNVRAAVQTPSAISRTPPPATGAAQPLSTHAQLRAAVDLLLLVATELPPPPGSGSGAHRNAQAAAAFLLCSEPLASFEG
ncbi:Cell division cycle-associated 7-like protein [Tetrabaena socialis]|uniref:Cell division cycle-associated 7-like protein n=1 Tax=Tetrabaena socialis TaxID=47790 RepID=A0A2J8A649_9CHLO|nr:Cell division cycle-associated 7-like protein [Tetrabaena socialis]|eukprot:PNH07988.1 Cell division cycle-associated 7-like protein [Tetrabaena socialis]